MIPADPLRNLGPATILRADARALSRHQTEAASQVLMPSVLYLMAATTEGSQVLAPVIGRVAIDVVPIKPLRFTAPLAVGGFPVQPVGLRPTTARRVRPHRRARWLRYSTLSLAQGIANGLWSRGAIDRISLTLRSAGHAIGRALRDWCTAIRAGLRSPTRIASGLNAARPAAPLRVLRKRLGLSAQTACFHATSLPGCQDNRFARWRIADLDQLAAVQGHERTKRQPDGDDLLTLLDDGGAA